MAYLSTEQITLDYAHAEGVSLEVATAFVASIVAAMEATHATAVARGTDEVVRVLTCPECHRQSEATVDIDWDTRVGKKVNGWWTCGDCGTSASFAVRLRTGERQQTDRPL